MVFPARQRHLLIIDTDADQAKGLQQLLAETGLPHVCHHVIDIAAALQLLKSSEGEARGQRPDIIILDVHTDDEVGCDTLKQLKADPELRRIPVIMLAPSADCGNVRQCYGEHVNAYIRKPLERDETLQVVREIESFWFHTARLPRY